MTEPADTSALSTIRDKELEMARRVDAARDAAEDEIRDAQADARAAAAAAKERGRAVADRMVEEATARAEFDGAEIRRLGAQAAATVRADVATRFEDVIDELVALVLSPPGEEDG